MIWKIIKRTVKYLFLLILTFILALYIEHFLSTDLPKTTGKFPVGRTTHRIAGDVNDSLMDKEVFTWIWYPATLPTGVKTKYLPDDWLKAVNDNKSFISNFFARDLGRVHTNSFVSPDISTSQNKFPVVLFRGGLSTLAPEYSSICEEIASHGYIVIGLDAPFLSRIYLKNDGDYIERSNMNNPELYEETIENFQKMIPRMASNWAKKATITLNYFDSLSKNNSTIELYKKMDFNQVSMVGHSLGGTAAIQFGIQDSRCKALINIDGLVTKQMANSEVNIASLFIIAQHSKSETNDSLNTEIQKNIKALIHNSSDSLITIKHFPNANHFNFSDGAFTKSHLLMEILQIINVIRMEPKEQIHETVEVIVNFLDAKFKRT